MLKNLLFIFFLFSSAINAKLFSFRDCIDLATQKNAELAAAYSNLESFDNLQGAARFNYFPQLSADIANDRGENIGLLRVNPSFDSDRTKTNTYVALLTLRQNVFKGLRDLGETRQAKANYKVSKENLLITKSKLSFDLKSAFEGLRFAKEYQKLTQQIIKRREENLNIVQLRYQNGMENRGSVLLSRANLEQAKYDDLVARNAEKVARAQLAQALGLDQFANIDILGEIPLSNPPINPDFRTIALSTPYYQEANYKVDGADAGVTIARSEFFPRLEIFATAGQQGTYLWPSDTERWSLGVTLTFPFFNGGRDYYGTKSAVNTRAATEANRIEVSRDILQKLQKAYADYIEAIQKNKMNFSFMEAAKLRAEIARKKYNNGLLIFDDWVIIEDGYVFDSKNYLLSKKERVIAEANWEYVQGKGVIP